MAERSDLVGTGVIAAVLSAFVCVFWFGFVADPPPDPPDPETLGHLISSVYDPPSTPIEAAFVKGDGQLFAGQATDPLVRRPEMVRGGPTEQAYRYQRPLYGWLGWIASGGRPGAVAVGLVVTTVLATVLLVLATVRWCANAGIDPRWSLVVLAVPGVWIDLTWIGPETLGTALLLLGLHVLRVHDPSARGVPVAALACFAAAGLCRETMLLVPLVLAAVALLRGRARDAATTAGAAIPYLLWVLFLRVRIGAWPLAGDDAAGHERLSLVPFGGMVDAAGGWHRWEWLFGPGAVVLAVVALAVGRRSGLRPVIAANLALAAVLGPQVWRRYPDFGRVLLPLCVLALVAVLTRRRPVESGPRRPGIRRTIRIPERHPRGRGDPAVPTVRQWDPRDRGDNRTTC